MTWPDDEPREKHPELKAVVCNVVQHQHGRQHRGHGARRWWRSQRPIAAIRNSGKDWQNDFDSVTETAAPPSRLTITSCQDRSSRHGRGRLAAHHIQHQSEGLSVAPTRHAHRRRLVLMIRACLLYSAPSSRLRPMKQPRAQSRRTHRRSAQACAPAQRGGWRHCSYRSSGLLTSATRDGRKLPAAMWAFVRCCVFGDLSVGVRGIPAPEQSATHTSRGRCRALQRARGSSANSVCHPACRQ
jgi:hypothetical protein